MLGSGDNIRDSPLAHEGATALAASDNPGRDLQRTPGMGHSHRVSTPTQKEKTEAGNGTKAMSEADVFRKCLKPWPSERPC